MFSVRLFPGLKSFPTKIQPHTSSFRSVHTANTDSLGQIHLNALSKWEKNKILKGDFEKKNKKTFVFSALDTTVYDENLSSGQIHLNALAIFALSKSKKSP